MCVRKWGADQARPALRLLAIDTMISPTSGYPIRICSAMPRFMNPAWMAVGEIGEMGKRHSTIVKTSAIVSAPKNHADICIAVVFALSKAFPVQARPIITAVLSAVILLMIEFAKGASCLMKSEPRICVAYSVNSEDTSVIPARHILQIPMSRTRLTHLERIGAGGTQILVR